MIAKSAELFEIGSSWPSQKAQPRGAKLPAKIRISAVQGSDIEVNDAAFLPGYGQVGQLAARAIKLMAEHEGLMLDPVYTAKSFAAIPALVASGDIEKGARVCFVHTGGLGAFFAYQHELADLF